MNKFFLILVLIFILYYCEKENNNTGEPDQPLVFTSLVAEKDTVEVGEQTKIVATATGYDIQYQWSASAGDILGSGSEVIYAASPCHIGENTISCVIKDGNNNSEKKEIIIVVL